MPTVRNQDTQPLSAERQFIVDAQAGGIVPHYFMQQLADISRQYRPEEAQDMINDLNALLRRLDYGTDMATVAEAHKPTSEEETGYWSGRYVLFDSEGTRYSLDMREDGASITVGDTVIKEYTLAAGLLKIADAHHAFELQFIPAVSLETVAQPAFDAASTVNATRARCCGTVTFITEAQPRTLKIEGKSGCFSQEGVASQTDGDPVALWEGQVTLLDTTGKDWQWLDDQLHLEQTGTTVAVKLGAVAATHVRFGDNMLECDFAAAGSQGATRFVGRFSMEADGSKRVHGAFDDGSKVRSITGFLTSPKIPPKAATHAGTLTLGSAQDRTPVLSIDLRQHVEGQAYDLPDGVAGTPYKVKLKLTSRTSGTAYTWSMASGPDIVSSPEFTITADALDKTVGLLAGTPNSTFYSLKVIAKETSGVLHSLELKLRLADKGAMRIVQLDLATLGETELTLPIGIERNRYTLLLEPKNIPAKVKLPLQWTLLKPDANYPYIFDISSYAMDDTLGVLHGTFGETEHAGHTHITLGLATTDTDATTNTAVMLQIKLHIPVESRLPFAPGFSELPPVIRNRHYRAKLSASGGDAPLRWRCDDTSALPPGLTFNPDKSEISGLVSDITLAQQTIGVEFVITGSDKVVMNSTPVTLFFVMQEPEQVAKEATDWILFVISLAGLGAIGFFFKSFLSKIGDYIKDGVTIDPEKESKAGEELHNDKFRDNFIEYKSKLSNAINTALDPEKQVDAKKALETARNLALSQHTELSRKRDAIQQDYNTKITARDADGTSLFEKAKLTLEIRELAAKLDLANQKVAEALRRHVELDGDLQTNDHESRRRERFHGF